MLWIIFALFSRITTSCFLSVLQKILVQKRWSPSMVVAASISIVAICLLAWISANGQWVATPAKEYWIWISVACLLDFTGNLLLVRAIGHGDISVIGPLNSYKPLVGVVLGVVFLRELPSRFGWAGIFIIVIGSWILVQGQQITKQSTTWRLSKPVRDRLLSIVLTATASIFLKNAIHTSNAAQAYFGWAIGCCALSWISLLLANRKATWPMRDSIPRLSGRDAGLLLASGISFLIMQGTTIWIFSQMQIGYALALFQLASIIQVFLGKTIFREDQFRRRIVASVVMTIGAILVLIAK